MNKKKYPIIKQFSGFKADLVEIHCYENKVMIKGIPFEIDWFRNALKSFDYKDAHEWIVKDFIFLSKEMIEVVVQHYDIRFKGYE